jgi:hypothetical protein
MTQLDHILQQISDLLEDRRMDSDDRQTIEEELESLQRRVRRFRSTEEYITYIESRLGRAKAIRDGNASPQSEATTDVTDWDGIDSIDAVDWSRVPLCGCHSPTCDLKRGSLPSACNDRSGGLLDSRTPVERIRNHIQRHPEPHVLRVAHRTWVEGYGELLADAQQLLSVARDKRVVHGSGTAEA